MKYFTKILSMIFLLVIAIQIVYPQCPISPGKGVKAPDWDRAFTQNGPGQGLEPAGSAGWTGGDSTYSLLLPNGSSAFFFSDSYIAEYPAKDGDATVSVNKNGLRTHKPNCFPPRCAKPETIHYVYNSIVVRSSDGRTLKTLLGPKDDKGFSTSFLKPKDPNHLFWFGDSALVRVDKRGTKKIWVFLFEWNINRPGDPFKLDFYGASIAQLNAETLAPEKVFPLGNVGEKDSHWGMGAWVETVKKVDTLYIYGKREINGKKKLFVARVDPSIGLQHASDTKNWAGWRGGAWGPGLTAAAPVIPESDSVSDEISVKRLTISGKAVYLMVTMDTGVSFFEWKDIYIYSACRPEGPFNDKHLVYTTPEAGSDKLPGMLETEHLANKMVIYNAHLHPQFTNKDGLLISYNSNLPFGALPGDSTFVDFYRPRFVRVPIYGLDSARSR